MLREYTCIICPNGCEIQAEGPDEGGEYRITGASCKRGNEYVLQEIQDPRRTFATSVAVRGGKLDLASVRLTRPIPLGKVMEAMKEIRKITLNAPVQAGEVVLTGLLGMDCDVIVTRSVSGRHK